MPENNDHQEMLKLLFPLIEHINQKGFGYVIMIGKDETCARYSEGKYDDVVGMLSGLAEKNPQFNAILKDSIV